MRANRLDVVTPTPEELEAQQKEWERMAAQEHAEMLDYIRGKRRAADPTPADAISEAFE